MGSRTTYYPGGYVPAATQQNRAELWDGTAGTYTAWDVNGVQTTTRPLTAAESSAMTAQDNQNTATANAATLRSRAQTALTNNATYQALTNPTNAQVVAQVAALTRQVNALIRLEISQLDSLNGA